MDQQAASSSSEYISDIDRCRKFASIVALLFIVCGFPIDFAAEDDVELVSKVMVTGVQILATLSLCVTMCADSHYNIYVSILIYQWFSYFATTQLMLRQRPERACVISDIVFALMILPTVWCSRLVSHLRIEWYLMFVEAAATTFLVIMRCWTSKQWHDRLLIHQCKQELATWQGFDLPRVVATVQLSLISTMTLCRWRGRCSCAAGKDAAFPPIGACVFPPEVIGVTSEESAQRHKMTLQEFVDGLTFVKPPCSLCTMPVADAEEGRTSESMQSNDVEVVVSHAFSGVVALRYEPPSAIHLSFAKIKSDVSVNTGAQPGQLLLYFGTQRLPEDGYIACLPISSVVSIQFVVSEPTRRSVRITTPTSFYDPPSVDLESMDIASSDDDSSVGSAPDMTEE